MKAGNSDATRRSRKSKAKGYEFEVEIVDALRDSGIDAFRIWGSDGRARGFSSRVDVVALESFLIQCKRKARLPGWLSLEDVHAVVIREDRGDKYALIRFADLLKVLRILAEKNSANNGDK